MWKDYTGLRNAHYLNSATVGLNLAFEIMKEEYVYSECCNNEIFSPDHSIIEAFYAKKDDILKTYNIVL